MATRDTHTLRDNGEQLAAGKIMKGRYARIPPPQVKLRCLGWHADYLDSVGDIT